MKDEMEDKPVSPISQQTEEEPPMQPCIKVPPDDGITDFYNALQRRDRILKE